MIFIALLIAITASVAGTAAFFSVYGLAATFSGVFWSVVAMGTSLEAAKLIATSFLYRYWTKTNIWLKSYLMLGTAALMLVTSVGIYGFLSAGYQQDALPLKQKQEQVRLLEEEKVRVLARKEQIDAQLSGGPQLGTLQNNNGRIDPNAARVLRETNRGRTAVVAQYKEEQTAINARAAELDKQLLELKQELIKVEAHTGPITFIAKAFGLSTDNSTSYLIMLIMFAFDPMAVALTLAVNMALRLRREEQSEARLNQMLEAYTPEPQPEVLPDTQWDIAELEPNSKVEDYVSYRNDDPHNEDTQVTTLPEAELVDDRVEPDEIEEKPPEAEPEPIEPAAVEPTVVVPIPDTVARRQRPYPYLWDGDSSHDVTEKLREIMTYHKQLRARVANGEQLSRDEEWELQATENLLRKHNLAQYI